jgi:hypothetical protein
MLTITILNTDDRLERDEDMSIPFSPLEDMLVI